MHGIWVKKPWQQVKIKPRQQLKPWKCETMATGENMVTIKIMATGENMVTIKIMATGETMVTGETMATGKPWNVYTNVLLQLYSLYRTKQLVL